jgi:hypothetical protein
LVCRREAQARFVALEQPLKITLRHRAAGWDFDALEQGPIAREVDILRLVLVAVGKVQGGCALGEIGRLRDVENLARELAQLGQGEGGFSAARATDQNQGQRQRKDLRLSIIKRQWLVEHVKLGSTRMQIAHGNQVFAQLAVFRRLETEALLLIDARAAQKARPIVRVLFDELERQTRLPPALLDKLYEQPAIVIELGSKERVARELLQVWAGEVIALDRRPHLREGSGQALRHIELAMRQELHLR